MKRKRRRIIAGISISEGELKLPKPAKREIRMQAGFLMRNGLVDEILRSGDPLHADRVLGRVGFWLQLEPNNIYAQNAYRSIRAMIVGTS